jgi:hypothetical protein
VYQNIQPMYIAPLNYDRFFRKIFSNPEIVKRFLEDFLSVKIEEITILKEKHRLSDEAMVVEFDYRCKIDGQYTIIDMQQWYKTDVVKRFYIYYCLNSALQLEDLPSKSVQVAEIKKKLSKDYVKLEPALTIIWMADDNLGSTESVLTFMPLPDAIQKFLVDDPLWQNENTNFLKEERTRLLKMYEQIETSQFQFLSKNKLIYAFQKNIIKDEKCQKYIRWFQFAEKSKNKQNKKEDFDDFLNDKIFVEMIRTLDKSTLEAEDFQYITDFEQFGKEYKQFQESLRQEIEEVNQLKGRFDGEKIGLAKGEQIGIQKGEQIGIQKGEQIGIQKGEQIGIQKGEQKRAIASAKKCLLMGMSHEVSAEISGLSIEEIKQLSKELG